MTQKMNTNQINLLPWPFLALGLVGVIMFILMLPFILGAFAVIGIFSGYLIWRVNKFFKRIEADHMWQNETEREEFGDRPIIDITHSVVDNNNK